MRYWRNLISSLLILTALQIPTALALTEDELRASIDSKSKELSEINKQLEATQQQLSATQVRGKTLTQEIGRIDANIKSVQLNIKSSEITIDRLGLEIVSLEDQITTKEQELKNKKNSIARLLQNVQEKDSENMLLTLLNHASLAESLAETQAVTDLNDQLLTAVDSLHEIKDDLNYKLEQVSGKKKDVESEHGKLKVKKDIIEDQRADRQSVLSQTKNQELAYQKMVSDLEAKQLAISNEIDRIEEELRRTADPASLPGKRTGALGYPVSSPRITQSYGATAFAQRAYKSKFHNGIDFAAPIGTPLYAAEDGVVVSATATTSRLQYGYYILIKHDNNLSTLYGHMSRFAVASGARVKRGDLIGYSGNTGYTTGPHLHFTVYQSASVQLKPFPGAGVVPVGVTLNPQDYL